MPTRPYSRFHRRLSEAPELVALEDPARPWQRGSVQDRLNEDTDSGSDSGFRTALPSGVGWAAMAPTTVARPGRNPRFTGAAYWK